MAVSVPTSWTDGLDWDNPQPQDVRYWLALRAAIFERAEAVGYVLRSDSVPDCEQYAALHISSAFADALYYLGRSYYIDEAATIEAAQEADGYSAPSSFSFVFWTWDKLVREVGEDLSIVPVTGSVWLPGEAGFQRVVNYMKAIKAAIDLLHVTPLSSRGSSTSCGGAPKWAYAKTTIPRVGADSDLGGTWDQARTLAWQKWLAGPESSTTTWANETINSTGTFASCSQFATASCNADDDTEDDQISYSVTISSEVVNIMKTRLLPLYGRTCHATISAFAWLDSKEADGEETHIFLGTTANDNLSRGFNYAIREFDVTQSPLDLSDVVAEIGTLNLPLIVPQTAKRGITYTQGCNIYLCGWLDHGVDGGFRFFTASA